MASDHGLRRDQIHSTRLMLKQVLLFSGILRPAPEVHLQPGEEPKRAGLRRIVVNRSE